MPAQKGWRRFDSVLATIFFKRFTDTTDGSFIPFHSKTIWSVEIGLQLERPPGAQFRAGLRRSPALSFIARTDRWLRGPAMQPFIKPSDPGWSGAGCYPKTVAGPPDLQNRKPHKMR